MEKLENLYDKVELKIQKISDDLARHKTNEANDKGLEIFNEFKKLALKELRELKDCAEWRVFTIAFYGETNAGKSTLIEALRLYFNEKTKLQEQEDFKQEAKEYLDWLKAGEEFEKLSKQKLEAQDALKAFMGDKGFFQKFLIFLGLNFEAKKHKNRIYDINNKIKALNFKEHFNQETKEKLIKMQDGLIIGDGRPDFTRNVTEYHFSHEGKQFFILDVPGIEGDEGIVGKEIEKAIKKAHAIFYIKKDPTPPQSGDDGKKGTIEKIKEQLNAQTEIVTVFNKPITHPRFLSRDLIDSNTQEGLEELDKEMSKILGNHYLSHKVLSAQPAFYALAESILPNEDLEKRRAKFLENFDKEALLQKAGFKDFCNFLITSFLNNADNKIRRVQIYKAQVLVDKFAKTLGEVIENYEELKSGCEDVKEGSIKVLCQGIDSLIEQLEIEANEEKSKAISKIKNRVYSFIDRDKDDSEVQDYFQEMVDSQFAIFEENIRVKMEELKERFGQEIQEKMEEYTERMKKEFEYYASIPIVDGFQNQIKINTNPEVDFWSVGSVVLSVAGGIALFSNPAGWVAIAAGLAGIVIGVVKKIAKFFSSSYKKSEQRKAVDRQLREIDEGVDDEIEKSLRSAKENKKHSMLEIQKAFEEPIIQIKNMIQTLKQEKEGLESIKVELKTSKENIK